MKTTNAVKMFQVTDDNHSAWFVLAQSARHAVEKVLKANPDIGEHFNETYTEDELVENANDPYMKNKGLVAYPIKDGAQVDRDGPVSFY